MFPNPTEGVFVIEIKEAFNVSGDVNIEIYDAVGNKVYENAFNSFGGQIEARIDLSNQPSGIFIMKAVQADKVIGLNRIVKQ